MKPQTYIDNRKDLSDDMPIISAFPHTNADIPNLKPDLRSALKLLSIRDKEIDRNSPPADIKKQMSSIALEVEATFNIDLEVLIGWIEAAMEKVPSQHDMQLLRLHETKLSLYAYAQAKDNWQKSYMKKIKSRRI